LPKRVGAPSFRSGVAMAVLEATRTPHSMQFPTFERPVGEWRLALTVSGSAPTIVFPCVVRDRDRFGRTDTPSQGALPTARRRPSCEGSSAGASGPHLLKQGSMDAPTRPRRGILFCADEATPRRKGRAPRGHRSPARRPLSGRDRPPLP